MATYTLYQMQSPWDQHVWGTSNDHAAYLHRLAITRSEIGTGLGKIILQSIEHEIVRKGIHSLRLDCLDHNKKLQNFYTNNEFKKQGTSDGHALFLKRCADCG